jgi:hypothetical protein
MLVIRGHRPTASVRSFPKLDLFKYNSAEIKSSNRLASRGTLTSFPFNMASDLPLTRTAWQDRLATLPGSPDAIPPFFFGHGSPLLVFSKGVVDRDPRWHAVIKHFGPESPLANFLHDFGPALLAKYQPKGILVFSAHWETQGEQLGMSFFLTAGRGPRPFKLDFRPYRETVTDYGDENPLLMDYYYNTDPELYELKFNSRGDTTFSKRVVELFQNVLLLPPHSFGARKPRRPFLHQFHFSRLVSALV